MTHSKRNDLKKSLEDRKLWDVEDVKAYYNVKCSRTARERMIEAGAFKMFGKLQIAPDKMLNYTDPVMKLAASTNHSTPKRKAS
jgi:hypothetical protein